MTENSFPWNGSSVGDHGPYTDTQWAGAWRRFFTIDPSAEGVLLGAGNPFAAANPSGRTVRLAAGTALVDGTWYEADASIDFTLGLPAPGLNRYDRIVLRKSTALQTVRMAVVRGVEAASPVTPVLTQTPGDTWEIPLARAYITAAGDVTLVDERRFCRHATVLILGRVGGDSSNWSTPGSSAYTPQRTAFQAGAASVTLVNAAAGQAEITFVSPFSAAPVLIAAGSNSNYLVSVVSASASGAILEVRHRDNLTNTLTINLGWLAAGPV